MKVKKTIFWSVAAVGVLGIGVMASSCLGTSGDASAKTLEEESISHQRDDMANKDDSEQKDKKNQDPLSVSTIKTDYGDLICLKPDMKHLKMDMVCGEIPSSKNDSIVLAFAGAFTGTEFYKGDINVAGDHVAGGKRYKGYRCKRNTGAFTWSEASGPQFYYKDYSSALDSAAKKGGMGFGQEMMIHQGRRVKTIRPAGDENIFRALCLDSHGSLAVYESKGKIKIGKFIDALLSQGVKEALYTDMGYGWNYCFYRKSQSDKTPEYLHSVSFPYASNFIVIKVK